MTIDTITTITAAGPDDDRPSDGGRTDHGAGGASHGASGIEAANVIAFADYANRIGAGGDCTRYAPTDLLRRTAVHTLHPDPEDILRSLIPDDLDPDGADAIFAALHDGRFADGAHEALFPYLAPRLAAADPAWDDDGGDGSKPDPDRVAEAIGHALRLARAVREIGPRLRLDADGPKAGDLLCGLDEAHQRLLVLMDAGDPMVPSVLPIIEPVVAECYALAIQSALGNGPHDRVDAHGRGDRS